MQFEASAGRRIFRERAELLPREDRRSMVAAEIMGSIYHALLRRMKRTVFAYSIECIGLNKPAKLFHISRQLLKIL